MKRKEKVKIKVHRTTKGTIFEVAFLILAIPMTLLVFSTPQSWPVLGTIALMIAVIIYYCVQIHKAK